MGSVDRQHPTDDSGSGGGGVGDLKWQEAYSVDWSSQSVHDFTADSTFDVDGVEWAAYNNSAGDFATDGFRTDGVDGLRIWPTADKEVWGNRVDAPIVSVKLADAVGVKTPYVMHKHAVCFQALYTAAQDVDNTWDAIGIIMWNSLIGVASGANYIYAATRGVAGSGSNNTDCIVLVRAPGVGNPEQFPDPTNRTLTERNFMQIIVWPGPDYIGGMTASLAPMPLSGEFPDPNDFPTSLLASGGFSTIQSGSAFTLANLRFGMSSSAKGTTGEDPTPIFTKCRVLYMEMV